MIEKIFHIADIHIRLFKRHGEYNKIFDKLFEYLHENVGSNDVIYLAGDIVHSKTAFSPELFDMTCKFLRDCADIAPTILITGNHDVQLSNTSRLDALTPVVNAIKHPNLHYWKDCAVYELGGIQWSVFSVFAEPDEWVLADEINADYKIALHHGPIASAVTDMGYKFENERTTPEIFEGFDLALLGDIHKHQYLDADKRVAYASSLIQQNHGESLNHGFMVWDVKERKGEFIEIENDVAYATIEVEDGKIVTDQEYLDKLPENLRLRVRYKNTDDSQISEIVSQLKDKYRLLDYVPDKLDSRGSQIGEGETELGDVRDTEYQNKMIVQYLESRDDIELMNLDRIKTINRKANARLASDEVIVRNLKWSPLKMKFDNMFSYGDNNEIDFTNMHGIQGLFAPNATGKSAFLDVMSFILFDKSTRAYQGDKIMNRRRDDMYGRLEFMLGKDKYVIERIGKRKKNGKVKVDVNFWREREDGEEENLNGDQRSETNDNIRNYVGSYDDFMFTALSSQNDNKNLVEQKQTDRQKLLSSFLDISVFSDLWEAIKDDVSDSKSELKVVHRDINEFDSGEVKNKRKEGKDELRELEKKRKEKVKLLKEGKDRLDEFKSKIKDVDFKKSKEEILKEKEEYQSKIQKAEEGLVKLDEKIKESGEELASLIKAMRGVDVNKLKKSRERDIQIDETITSLKREIEKLGLSIDHNRKTVDNLKDHEYDPECEYCVKNQFVIDAKEAEKLLPKLEKEKEQAISEKEALEKEKEELASDIKMLADYDKVLEKYKDADDKFDRYKENKEKGKDLLETYKEMLSRVKDDEKRYEKNQGIIEENKKYEEKVAKGSRVVSTIESEINEIDSDIMSQKVSISRLDERLDAYNKKVERVKELEDEVFDYECYKDAVSRSGVPYLLLKKVLPILQTEVNEILENVVDFSVEFIAENRKNIEIYIINSEDNSRPVEIGSGMEKFMISVATRISLIGITSLPRPNFIAVDEGFSVLDSDHINSVYNLFEHVKGDFDFMILISHLNDMKDLADELIHIDVDDHGYSCLMTL